MFGSAILDIAIGVVITFAFLSLVVTAGNELVATFFRSRARDLERGIRNLLDGKSDVPERWWNTVWRFVRRKNAPTPGNWSETFFKHQLVNGLSKDGEKPSYIPSQTFAMVLLDLVRRSAGRGEKTPPWEKDLAQSPLEGIRRTVETIDNTVIRDVLLPLIAEAQTAGVDGMAAVKKFGDQVEIWYDHAMDRVSGWYKRRTQWVLFGIAIVVAISLNVDTLEICRSLGRDDTLRTALVETAKKAQPASSDRTADEFSEIKTAIANVQGLGIPLGWTFESDTASASPHHNWSTFWKEPAPFKATKLMGLLLTAFAVSLGAPFWFDILNKLITVRGAGKAPEEKPKKPKVILQPLAPEDTP